ncbi:MAG: hypothetical protein A2284_13350 [Deltaproteobacteria bacterium RIFOXYA12_FULL_61_11]|nr:MAG: hypothetical protein A2284_13350 [Deltaproteobacteria bacterium RIFOXYA12_FULL_61_11]
MVIMLLVGLWSSRRITNTRDYIIAGGRLGWLLGIGTLFATWFGGETCMGSSRMAFEEGLLGVIADPFGAGLCLILSGLFFTKVFRRMQLTTIIDYFEWRYGGTLGRIFSVLYLPVYLGWLGGQLLAFGLIINALVGIPTLNAILLSTGVVLLYTYSGGMWAVSVTDFLQMVFIVLGLLVLFPLLVTDLGGFAQLHRRLPEHVFHFYPREVGVLGWLGYLQAWMMVGIGSLPAQDLFQRIMAPKSERIASLGAIFAGLLYLIIGLLPVFLGIYGRVALPGSDGESILIELAQKYLPLPLMVLMLGALLSAIMSSADSALLAPAGIIGHNIIPCILPTLSEEGKLRWCRYAILLVCGSSLLMALYFQNVYELCTNAWGVLLVGLAAPMILGVFWKGANAWGAGAGALVGVVSWIGLGLTLSDDHPVYLYAFFLNVLTLVLGSILATNWYAPQDRFPLRS